MNVVILVPRKDCLPEDFTRTVNGMADICPNIHWAIPTQGGNPLSSMLRSGIATCQIITVSAEVFDIAADGFNKCATNRLRTSIPHDLFTHREADFRKYPRNLKFTVLIGNAGGSFADIMRIPDVSAIVAAYATLNTTLELYDGSLPGNNIFAIEFRRAHFTLYPQVNVPLHPNRFYNYALYNPCPLRFFTRRVRRNTTSLQLSSTSIIVFLACILPLGFAITLVYICKNSAAVRNFSTLSQLVLFLVATFVGRAPANIRSEETGRKVLLAGWLIGTFFLGSYLQSYITAESYAPIFQREVEDVETLKRLMETKKIIPCFEIDATISPQGLQTKLFPESISYIKVGCGNCYVKKLVEECFRLTRQGTHVYIRPCCFYDHSVAQKQGLVESLDSFFLYQRQATVHRNMPFRHQHRRVILEVSESGMDIHEAKKVDLMSTKESELVVVASKSRFICIYVTGCASSVVVLCLEILAYKFLHQSSRRSYILSFMM
ncbi:hypothetical protein HPB48_007774 [Haemaphysalis longicornis]|uniref:Ionotropic receptor n=1 Tax=Haemaphysalis longicornis TaxID=44386 RepID=A0A9J6FQJ7_HAELO|nr:hypothetical protein HPB48_007774 [Haemaphysalis longicornis]